MNNQLKGGFYTVKVKPRPGVKLGVAVQAAQVRFDVTYMADEDFFYINGPLNTTEVLSEESLRYLLNIHGLLELIEIL